MKAYIAQKFLFESLKIKERAEINNFLKDSINMLTVGDVNSNIPYRSVSIHMKCHIFLLTVCASSFIIIQFIYTGNTQCHSLMNVSHAN